jgi:hypothetical protein
MAKGASVNLDSFLDIMTCLVGCLVLILILTSIDAGQIKVLINTPIEKKTDKRPIYIECRNNELFRVPVADLTRETNETLGKIADEAGGDRIEMLRLLQQTPVENETYTVDLSYALIGQFALAAKPGMKGYALKHANQEKRSDWLGQIITRMDKEKEMLSFLVRDDSYNVFKHARAVAWKEEVVVSYELLDVDEVIKFGLGGTMPMGQ